MVGLLWYRSVVRPVPHQSLEWCRTSTTSVIGISLLVFCHTCRNNSVVCIVTTLWAGIQRGRGWIPGRNKRFITSVKRADRLSGPSFRLLAARPSSPEAKWSSREGDHSPPPSVEVKNEWSYTATPLYALMACTAPLPSVYVRARVLKDNHIWIFNTSESCLGPSDVFCKVYIIFTAQPGIFRTVCNRVRVVAELKHALVRIGCY